MKYLIHSLLLSFLLASSATAQLSNGLVAYWKLDEASDQDAIDATGNGNTLTDTNGLATTTGILNGGRTSVAANSERLSIADNADLSFGDEDMTISFWFYQSSITVNAPLLGKWDWGVSLDNEYLVYIAPGPDVRFNVSNTGTGADGFAQSNALSTNTWYHVVAYHDATANEVGIIVNDGTPATSSYSGGIRDGTHDFQVANSNSIYTDITRIDEIGIWNRVLTSQEITDLYNSGSGLSYDSFGSGGNPIVPGINAAFGGLNPSGVR